MRAFCDPVVVAQRRPLIDADHFSRREDAHSASGTVVTVTWRWQGAAALRTLMPVAALMFALVLCCVQGPHAHRCAPSARLGAMAVGRAATAGQWGRFFDHLAPSLASAWQKRPALCLRGHDAIVGQLDASTIARLIDEGTLPAGRAALGQAGDWSSKALERPTAEVIVVSTVYANNAGMYIPSLAGLCLAAVDTLGWPVTANAYLSAPGLEVSVPAHTDRQDVVILQTTGQKRWSVFAPPAVGAADPFRRGKDGDALASEALGAPLLEATLGPGDVLYVPLGFPHATSTAKLADAAGDPSVHITLNLDSLIWGLSYRLLWAAAQERARQAGRSVDGAIEEPPSDGMPWSQYSALQTPLPLGFVGEASAECLLTKCASCSESDEAATVSVPRSLRSGPLPGVLRERAARWLGIAPERAREALSEDEDIHGSMDMLLEHRARLLTRHRHMYLDVMLSLTDLAPLEREMAHWGLLEAEMKSLRCSLGWEDA